MIEYGTFERREGSYDLQEVVRDYVPRNSVRKNYYNISYLKIVRTPNCHKLVDSKIIGIDYVHHVHFCIVTPNRKWYFGPSLTFPDTQEGLNDAEKFADHVMTEYNKYKNVHPKRWVDSIKHYLII